MKNSNDDLAESIASLADMVGEQFNIIGREFKKVDKRFEQIDQRFDKVESKLDDHSSQIHSLQVSNAQILSKLDALDGCVEALENDIKDIYSMLNDKQNTKPKSKKTLEQQVVDAYNNIVAIAEEAGIKLPS